MGLLQWARDIWWLSADIAAIDRVVREVRATLDTVNWRTKSMSAELDTLRNEVAETRTVIGSAVALLAGLKAKLDAAIAAGDPAALTALSAELDASQADLAAAIAANTPAE